MRSGPRDDIDQKRCGAAAGNAADVDAVAVRLLQHGCTGMVVAHDADERDRHPQLCEADGLVGALAAEQLIALQDRDGIAGRRRPVGTQHQVACDLTDHHNAHQSTVPTFRQADKYRWPRGPTGICTAVPAR